MTWWLEVSRYPPGSESRTLASFMLYYASNHLLTLPRSGSWPATGIEDVVEGLCYARQITRTYSPCPGDDAKCAKFAVQDAGVEKINA